YSSLNYKYKIVGQFYFLCGVGTVHKQLDENAIKRKPDYLNSDPEPGSYLDIVHIKYKYIDLNNAEFLLIEASNKCEGILSWI
ncbi:MAG: hypothetical protein ACK559_35735, partial [bacterium]